MNRRDFIKSFSLAVAAFSATQAVSLTEDKRYSAGGALKPLTVSWNLEGSQHVTELSNDLGMVGAIVCYGWRVTITKTSYGAAYDDPEPLSATDLEALQKSYGLPGNLAAHLRGIGFERFLTHQRRCRTVNGVVAIEQDWTAWQDEEQNELLLTPCTAPR